MGAKGLKSLKIYTRICSRRALLRTLEQRGPFLSKLELVCDGLDLSARTLPCLGYQNRSFEKEGLSALTSLCLHRTGFGIETGRLQPSTISRIANGLPALKFLSISSSLSEDDIVDCGNFESVSLSNVRATHAILPIRSSVTQCTCSSTVVTDGGE